MKIFNIKKKHYSSHFINKFLKPYLVLYISSIKVSKLTEKGIF